MTRSLGIRPESSNGYSTDPTGPDTSWSLRIRKYLGLCPQFLLLASEFKRWTQRIDEIVRREIQISDCPRPHSGPSRLTTHRPLRPKIDVRNTIFDQPHSVEGSGQHGKIAARKPPVANVSIGASVSGQRHYPLGLQTNTTDIGQHRIPSRPWAFGGSCAPEADASLGRHGDSNGWNPKNFSLSPENA